jgi:hypothetical protein
MLVAEAAIVVSMGVVEQQSRTFVLGEKGWLVDCSIS